MLITKQFQFPLTSTVWTKSTMEVNGNILECKFPFCVNSTFIVMIYMTEKTVKLHLN